MTITTKAFGAYDLRGIYPAEVNEELYYRIGRAFPSLFEAKKVAVGRDIRLSGESLVAALVRGLGEAGCEAVDIGLCGTEMIYHAAGRMDGGLMVTASHNPKEYNGLKLVRKGAVPLTKDELKALASMVQEGAQLPPAAAVAARSTKVDMLEDYLQRILSFVDVAALKPLKIVANSGNGAAGPVVEALARHLPFEIIPFYGEPDGSFPHGVPNPLLPENREATARAVVEHGADFGVAWDGDFDRCFLYDEKGNFIEGYYMVGFLAQAFLEKHAGARVVYDPRCIWNTIELVEGAGGEPVVCKGGHAFIKAKMREVDAIYGGEMSAHHYFRDFSYCDSGMIPWLLVAELVSRQGRSLSSLLGERMASYPVSGEINTKVESLEAAKSIMDKVERAYATLPGCEISRIDGLSVSFPDWRFNLRRSNTEPLIRLNVETRGDSSLCQQKTRELTDMLAD
ncbi:phosphomannomutase [Selenomonas sp. KH1T6]|uniref:phosphomannomutase n=1 Tax=Selenomonas sp. KH1T6 TaxID=3158784 RepID=UPI0008A72FFA|nr:phosphomannomutase [Selenomonas ruminantium]